MAYSWPLNTSNYTFLDRLKICGFFLNPKNRWTYGNVCKKLENEMAEFIGCKYAVCVSSGSTANTILAHDLKDNVYTKNKNTVVFPTVGWLTTYSPFIREGFKPHFIDVNLSDLSIDRTKLINFLEKNHNKVAAVVIVSLLGFAPDVSGLIEIEAKYKVKIILDNCESHLTEHVNAQNISSIFTSTTSMYFGHQIQTTEMGFIFTNNEEEYKRFLLFRNHGMIRSLLDQGYKQDFESRKNILVNEKFDFNLLGNNYRNSDVHAFLGRLDFKRRYHYINSRRYLYKTYFNHLNLNKYILPIYSENDVPFSLPIIIKSDNKKYNIYKIVKKLDEAGIESRPIVSSNILRHTPFYKYAYYKDYPIAEKLTKDGCYVGLHHKLKTQDIINLCKVLNDI